MPNTAPRTNRLFDVIQILRDGRLHRAAGFGTGDGGYSRARFGAISEALRHTGLAIEGERGVGYILRMPLALPQMMLTGAEFEALREGLRRVADGGDPQLAKGARSLAGKIAAVTPASADASDLFAARAPRAAKTPPFVPALRRAIRGRNLVSITAILPPNILFHSDMRPLFLDLKSKIWTLTAYCHSARDFRVLRLDRIAEVTPLRETYPREAGRELADFRALPSLQ
ncbi:MAG: WYL domain-containing protein [Cypionkella sp.]|nr:WYL domain-containing protein [Cypionkella sp.]